MDLANMRRNGVRSISVQYMECGHSGTRIVASNHSIFFTRFVFRALAETVFLFRFRACADIAPCAATVVPMLGNKQMENWFR
jgi:hypothetical protein